MKTITRRAAWALGGLAALWSCGGGDLAAPSDPTPHAVAGALLVSLGGGRSDLGAVILTISGGKIDSLTAAGYRLFPSRTSDSDFRAIVVGNLVTGAIVKMWVPDVAAAPRYHVTADEAAGRDLSEVDPSSVALSVAAP